MCDVCILPLIGERAYVDGNLGGFVLSLVGKIQNSSVMVSESDPSSEEETLFVNSKPLCGNSRLPNGFPSRTAAARNRLKT